MDRFDPDVKASLETHPKSKMAAYREGAGATTGNVSVDIVKP